MKCDLGHPGACDTPTAPWVILPYADDWPRHEVEAALDATGWDYERVSVAGSDRYYFDLLSELWSAGDAFCIVEQDVVVHPTALDELAACPNDWCGFPHMYGWPGGQRLTHSLGCVKFDAGIIARNPDAMIRVGTMCDAHHPKRHWCRLDAWLQGCILPDAGEVKCCHETVVGHLGNGCAHGCIPNG